MTTIQVPFSAFLALADCAARAFAQHRTSRHPDPDSAGARRFLRHEAVAALRYLWNMASPDERATLACRVAAWMGRPVAEIQARVAAREKARPI